MRPVTREEKLNLAGEYVRARKKTYPHERPFDGLDDYVMCIRGIGSAALVFDRDEDDSDRLMQTQDITLLLETLNL